MREAGGYLLLIVMAVAVAGYLFSLWLRSPGNRWRQHVKRRRSARSIDLRDARIKPSDE
jgi:hypothetical protein